MINDVRDVYVYVFESLDKYSTNDYVKMATVEYLKSVKDEMLKKETVFSEELFCIKRMSKGKPYFPNCKDIGFSVSHSGKYIVCALTNGNVGIDIEQKNRFADESEEQFSQRLCKIAQRFFHPQEVDFVKSDPNVRFYEVFTAKESYVKLTGTGFDETLAENSVLPVDALIPSGTENLDFVSWSSGAVNFYQTKVDNDTVLCICTEQNCHPHLFFITDL